MDVEYLLQQAKVYLTYLRAGGGPRYVPEQGGGGSEQQRGVPAGRQRHHPPALRLLGGGPCHQVQVRPSPLLSGLQ